jgi:hypothetical protein
LPQPLGPTTPTSWPGSMKLVGSAKDLNPDNLIELRRTVLPENADCMKAPDPGPASGWDDTVLRPARPLCNQR